MHQTEKNTPRQPTGALPRRPHVSSGNSSTCCQLSSRTTHTTYSSKGSAILSSLLRNREDVSRRLKDIAASERRFRKCAKKQQDIIFKRSAHLSYPIAGTCYILPKPYQMSYTSRIRTKVGDIKDAALGSGKNPHLEAPKKTRKPVRFKENVTMTIARNSGEKESESANDCPQSQKKTQLYDILCGTDNILGQRLPEIPNTDKSSLRCMKLPRRSLVTGSRNAHNVYEEYSQENTYAERIQKDICRLSRRRQSEIYQKTSSVVGNVMNKQFVLPETLPLRVTEDQRCLNDAVNLLSNENRVKRGVIEPYDNDIAAYDCSKGETPSTQEVWPNSYSIFKHKNIIDDPLNDAAELKIADLSALGTILAYKHGGTRKELLDYICLDPDPLPTVRELVTMKLTRRVYTQISSARSNPIRTWRHLKCCPPCSISMDISGKRKKRKSNRRKTKIGNKTKRRRPSNLIIVGKTLMLAAASV